jgi:hypothetical protein
MGNSPNLVTLITAKNRFGPRADYLDSSSKRISFWWCAHQTKGQLGVDRVATFGATTIEIMFVCLKFTSLCIRTLAGFDLTTLKLQSPRWQVETIPLCR